MAAEYDGWRQCVYGLVDQVATDLGSILNLL